MFFVSFMFDQVIPSLDGALHYIDHVINTLRPRQNGRHFSDDIFKCIFSNENVWISIEISLKFVPQGPINNIPALVQIVAWRWPSHYLGQWWLGYRRIYGSLGLNELRLQLSISQELCTWLMVCWVLLCRAILPISFRVTSHAVGQSCDYPTACEVTLKDMGNLFTWINKELLM